MSTDFAIDLDAAVRETEHPEGVPVKYQGATYVLPAEFPIDVIDPLLDPEFDLVGLLGKLMAENDGDGLGATVVDVLVERPTLLLEARDTIYACFRLLFGPDQFADFQSKRPGLQTYALLIRSLLKTYGVGLGESFASRGSSESAGATSSPTSSAGTSSTPEPSAAAPEPETASSESAASAAS